MITVLFIGIVLLLTISAPVAFALAVTVINHCVSTQRDHISMMTPPASRLLMATSVAVKMPSTNMTQGLRILLAAQLVCLALIATIP